MSRIYTAVDETSRTRLGAEHWSHMSLFESVLSVPAEDIEFTLWAMSPVPWADYALNPRRLRGSDFLMRWSQGRWSEERIIHAVNDTGRYFALPYGPSGTAPEGDVREVELYFDRLEKAGLGRMKRPDLLVFRADDRTSIERLLHSLDGLKELPFTPEDDRRMAKLIELAVLAVECENSLWVAKKMPDYGSQLRPQRRLGGRPGLKKNAVVPTIILKEEDRRPLSEWQRTHGIPVHIWHVFYDLAFGIALADAERLITSGHIEEAKQVFQAPSGATTRKSIYRIYYHHAYPLGEAVEEPELVAASITDKNGHILPYVRFKGGKLVLCREVLRMLDSLAQGKPAKP